MYCWDKYSLDTSGNVTQDSTRQHRKRSWWGKGLSCPSPAISAWCGSLCSVLHCLMYASREIWKTRCSCFKQLKQSLNRRPCLQLQSFIACYVSGAYIVSSRCTRYSDHRQLSYCANTVRLNLLMACCIIPSICTASCSEVIISPLTFLLANQLHSLTVRSFQLANSLSQHLKC